MLFDSGMKGDEMPRVHKNVATSRKRGLIIAIILVIVIIKLLFFGENSLISLGRYKDKTELKQENYNEAIVKSDSLDKIIHILKTDMGEIERIAREKWDMQRPDEKVTIIKESVQNKSNSDEE